MNGLNALAGPSYYLEIGQDFVKAIGEEGGAQFAIERQPNGRLAPASKEKLTLSLQSFFKHKAWQSRPRVYCGISARGVSLRRLTLPLAAKEDLHRLLLLQIESEFPVSPDELAWGYQPVKPMAGAETKQDLLVVAVKKEVIEEYAELLAACGVSSFFTLAALARSRLCPQPLGHYALLNIGARQSEWMSFTDGTPDNVRVLTWGQEDLTSSLQTHMGISQEEAKKLSSSGSPLVEADARLKAQAAVAGAVEALAGLLPDDWTGQKIYLTGGGVRELELAPELTKRLGYECAALEPTPAPGRSAAVLGLKQAMEQMGASPLLLLQVKQTNANGRMPRPVTWKLARPAVALALVLLALPYAEALVLKPFLARKLATLKADRGRLVTLDRELGFLQYLKENQSPYLDAMFLLSKAAPPGAHIDSLSMNRHGDLALKISMREPTQVVDFRAKLIDSGFFTNVAVEEQAPTPDRQKLNVRLNGQWKGAPAREGLAIGPTAEEIEKAKTNKPSSFAGPPPMGMPVPGGGPEIPGMSVSGRPSPGKRARASAAQTNELKAPVAPGPNGGVK